LKGLNLKQSEDWTNVKILFFASTRDKIERAKKNVHPNCFFIRQFFYFQFNPFILNLFGIRLSGLFQLPIYGILRCQGKILACS